jgi:hypothetical protein
VNSLIAEICTFFVEAFCAVEQFVVEVHGVLFFDDLIGSVLCVFGEIDVELEEVVGEADGGELFGAGDVVEVDFG